MILKTFDKAKNQTVIVGQFYDGKFYKSVERSKHFMRIEKGYGIQEDVLQQLKDLECEFIIITDSETSGVYYSRLDEWFKKELKDYGNGLQRFLSIKNRQLNQTILV